MMATKKYKITKVSPEFKELLDEIKRERIAKGKNKRMLSDRRLTLAIARIGKLKELLLEAEINENE